MDASGFRDWGSRLTVLLKATLHLQILQPSNPETLNPKPKNRPRLVKTVAGFLSLSLYLLFALSSSLSRSLSLSSSLSLAPSLSLPLSRSLPLPPSLALSLSLCESDRRSLVQVGIEQLVSPFHTRKVDTRLPEKGNSNSHGARPVHLNHPDD